MMRPLIVDNVRESQFQVLLGIDFLQEAGACLDMQRCRMTYDLPPATTQFQQPCGRGACEFSMNPPTSLLFTEAAQQPSVHQAATTAGPPAAMHAGADGAVQQLDVIYPLALLSTPQQAYLYVVSSDSTSSDAASRPAEPASQRNVQSRHHSAAAAWRSALTACMSA